MTRSEIPTDHVPSSKDTPATVTAPFYEKMSVPIDIRSNSEPTTVSASLVSSITYAFCMRYTVKYSIN